MSDIKILRQNQGAGGKVLKQNEAAGGKLVKQNYNFGNCLHRQTTGGSIAIPLSFLSTDSWTICVYFNLKTTTPASLNIVTSNNTSDIRFLQFGGQVYHQVWINGASRAGNLFSPNALIISHNGSGQFRILNDANSVTVYNGVSFPVDVLNLLGGATALHRLLVYDRILSYAEMAYIVNNKTFNPPLSRLGLTREYLMRNASIINDSYVGIVDSGTDQIPVEMGDLPVGTLQEQLDYANQNYFRPFL